MTSMLKIHDWSKVIRTALDEATIRARLAERPGWSVEGEGASRCIMRSYAFGNYFETMAFVNAVAWIAHRADHHPDLSVHYNRCVVRFSTHDVGGISAADFDCAAAVDALVD